MVYFGLSPFPVIVTTRIITFLVGNPYNRFACLFLQYISPPCSHSVAQAFEADHCRHSTGASAVCQNAALVVLGFASQRNHQASQEQCFFFAGFFLM